MKQIKKYQFNVLSDFIKSENSSSILLLTCAIIALLLANSDFTHTYNEILHTNVSIGFPSMAISMSLLHWINDGLMAIFFFVVGLEIKREFLIGELNSIKTMILPVAAAIGGIIVPAVIYIIFNINQSTINGFGIPMATDIAFALGVLSLIKNAPRGIVIFLTALAVVDDLGAIIVIALFYTTEIAWIYLIYSLIIIATLIIMNYLKIKSTAVFIILGIIMWFTVLKSGIHATIAGVVLGLLIPCSKDEETFKTSMLHKLEHNLSPWTSFLIMPIFALSNAGVSINKNQLTNIMTTSVSLGIVLGLFLGKQIGIYFVSFILLKFKIANLPNGVNKNHLYGASILGGIGFTMSIFVSSLSFTDETLLNTAKLSIIFVSVISAITGIFVFSRTTSKHIN